MAIIRLKQNLSSYGSGTIGKTVRDDWRWLKYEAFLNSSVGLGNTETDPRSWLLLVEQMEALVLLRLRRMSNEQ